jgi:hypothetical protein
MPPVIIPSSTFEVRVWLYCGLRSSSPPDLVRPAAHESLFYTSLLDWIFLLNFLLSRAYPRAVRCNQIETRPTWNPPPGRGPAPLGLFTHGSDIGRNQLTIWSFATEAYWLRDKGFAVLAAGAPWIRQVEGINGEDADSDDVAHRPRRCRRRRGASAKARCVVLMTSPRCRGRARLARL